MAHGKFLASFSSILVVVICHTSAFSQKSFRIGLSGGVVISELSVSPEPLRDPVSRKGILAAVIGELSINQAWSFQLAPRYIENGIQFNSLDLRECPICGGISETTVDLNYLELPILVKLRIVNDQFTPFIFGGGSVAILMSAQMGSFDIMDNYERTDIRATLGAGIEFKASTLVSLSLEAASSHGYKNIVSEDNGSEIHTENYQLSFGALYQLW
jgi:hypothetical protein